MQTAKVPFADMGRVVAGVSKEFSDGGRRFREPPIDVVEVFVDAEPQRIASGHDGGSSWRTNRRRRVKLSKRHAFSGQFVDVRRFYIGTAEARQVSMA